MKDFVESMKLTKKSIAVIWLFIAAAIFCVAASVGFHDSEHRLISFITISVLLVFAVGYAVAVLFLYYHIPKNRNKDKTGILFFVDTHGNADDFKAIREKFYEQFTDIADSGNQILAPVFLSEKNVFSYRRAFSKSEEQKKLLLKAHCTFGLFMRATDTGAQSDTYELKLNATVHYESLSPIMGNILEHNFRFVMNGLHENTINRKKDLVDFKRMSEQLYSICCLLIAVALRYRKYPWQALSLMDLTYSRVAETIDDFCKQIKKILCAEMLAAYTTIVGQIYDEYCLSAKYDLARALDAERIILKHLSSLPLHEQMQVRLAKAINLLMKDDTDAAIREIDIISGQHKKVHMNAKGWLYFQAFLHACQDNRAKYCALIREYEDLKYNNISATKIQSFMLSYQATHRANLGVQIGLYCLTYYRSDLSMKSLPKDFRQSLIDELTRQKLTDIAQLLEKMQ